MKMGKVSENVLKRSILRQLKTKRDEVLYGAGIGEDCVILTFEEVSLIAITTSPVTWDGTDAAKYAFHAAINDLAASGAESVAVTISALLPIDIEEAAIKAMIAQLEEECSKLHIQIAGGHTEITDAVIRPVVTMTGIGKLKKENISSVANIKPGQDIVVSKWIALEGTARIAKKKEEELITKYPYRFIEEARNFERFLSVVPEAALAVKSGVCAMHDAAEGGIFGALWEMAEGAGVGLEIDLKKLPIRQETIEICEFYEINPYALVSGGCLLMVADNGYDLAETLRNSGIPAVVVGKTTDSNDRIIKNEEERRFLEPPKSDELYKVV